MIRVCRDEQGRQRRVITRDALQGCVFVEEPVPAAKP